MYTWKIELVAARAGWAIVAALWSAVACAQPGAFIAPVQTAHAELAGLAQLADGTLLYADAYGVYRVKGTQLETLLSNPVQGGYCVGSFPGAGCINWAPLVYHTKPMAADSSGAIYIADPERQLLERYDEFQQAFVTIATGVGAPTSLAADTTSLYFNDPTGCRVLRGSQSAVSTVAGTGTCGYSNDGGPATSAQILAVTAIALDAAGNLYIADARAGVVRRVDTSGTIMTIVGTGNPGEGAEAVPANATPLNGPDGLAVDAQGDLFIAEAAGNRIRMVGFDGLVRTVAGSSNTSVSPVDQYGYALLAPLAAPGCLAMGSSSGLLICDSGGNSIAELLPVVPGRWAIPLENGAYGLPPQSWVSVLGDFSGLPTMDWSNSISPDGALPTSLAGVTATVAGQPCVVSYVSPSRIDLLLPAVLASGWQSLNLNWPGGSLANSVLTRTADAEYLAQTLNGILYALATGPDGSLITPDRPARPGETITLYATGLNITGPMTPPYDTTQPNAVQVVIGGEGYPAISAAPFSPGVFQVVVRIPPTLGAAEYPLHIFADGFFSSAPTVLPVGAAQ
ncbi:MAG: hypothetical protein ABSH45_00695 [Bryobacteraceae bacterium]